MNRKILLAMLVFSGIALIISGIIVFENASDNNSINNICTATGSNCNAVQNSQYGKVLGVTLGTLGLGAFLLLTAAIIIEYFKPTRITGYIVPLGATLAGLVALVLIVIQTFILKQFCILCLIVDVSSIILLILAVIYLVQNAKAGNMH